MVAKRLVHQAESVEVEREQRQLGAAARRAEDRLRGALGGERAVGQAGERIAHRQVLDARLGGLARGDVGRGAAQAAETADRVSHRHGVHRLPDRHSAARHEAMHEAAEFLLALGEQRLAGRQEIGNAPSEQVAARISQHALGALRQVGEAPRGIGLPDIFLGGRGDVAEAVLALGKRALGALAPVDVRDHARHVQRAAGGVARGDAAARVQPLPFAARGGDPELRLVFRRLALQRAHPCRRRALLVLGMDAAEEIDARRVARGLRMAEEAHPAVARRELAGLRIEMPLREIAAVERELEALLGLEQAPLGEALLGDVVADAAVAEEHAVGADARLAGDDVDLARAALVRARDLEVEERLAGREAFEVRAERAGIDLGARDLPEAPAVGLGVAEEQRHRPAAREPGDAVLGVGLPEPVGGKLGEAAEPIFIPF